METTHRIGILSPFYAPFVGGAELIAERVARELAARGHRVSVRTLRHEEDLPLKEAVGDVAVERFPFQFRRLGGFTDVQSPGLVAAMEGWDVDQVHVHSATFPTLLLRAVRALNRRRVPTILINHGIFEALQGTHSGLRAVMYRGIMHPILRRLLGAVTTVGACSHFDLEALAEAGIRPEHYGILYNGVDLPESPAIPEGSGSRPLRLLHVASIKPNKGHLDVLEALRDGNLPIEYHIIGSGGDLWRDHMEKVDARIVECGLQDRVVRHGRVDDARRDELYRQSDVVIVPSHAETFPLSVLEGMSYARPVVATRVGGVADMIDSGETGLLVAPRCPEQIRDALEQLLESGLRDRLGQRARRRVEEDFSWASVVERYEHLTEETLARSRSVT